MREGQTGRVERTARARLLLTVALLALAAPGAASCSDTQCWTNGYEFHNATSTTVSVVFRASDGSETPIFQPLPPGEGQAAGSGVGCDAAGTLIARDASGREVARQAKPAAQTTFVWVIAEGGPVPATIVNGLEVPVRRVEFTGEDGKATVVARDLAPGASASFDAATFGDPSTMCYGGLDAYVDGRDAPVAFHGVGTCAEWSWTVSRTFSVANGTSIPVRIFVNGIDVDTLRPGTTEDPIRAASVPPRPWSVEAFSPSGRLLATMTVAADDPLSDTDGRVVSADLACGRLVLWAGAAPTGGPTFVADPSKPCK